MRQNPIEVSVVKEAIDKASGDAKLIIAMCFYTGRRIGDVVSLKTSSIVGDRIFFSEQKTGKLIDIAIHPALKKLLTPRLKNEFLFPSRVKGRHITKQWANKLIKRSLGSDKSSHALRKTLATFLYDQSKDVLLVMTFLNHSSPATTLRYIGVDTGKIDHIINSI